MADLDDVLGKVFTKPEPKKQQETMNFQAQSGVIGHVIEKPKPTVLDYVDKPSPKPTGSIIFGKVYRRRG